MIFFQKILCKVAAGIIITACVIATTASAESFNSMTDHWGKLHAKLDDTLTLLAEKQTLPESTWNPFKEDKQSLDKKINDLLEEADWYVDAILGGGENDEGIFVATTDPAAREKILKVKRDLERFVEVTKERHSSLTSEIDDGAGRESDPKFVAIFDAFIRT